jgi:zinc transport system substrate-binding protein
MNKRALIVTEIIFFILIIVGVFIIFQIPKPATKSVKLQVMTSFYPLYFFIEQIAGDKADVVNITPVGVEPHDYEPTAQDMAQIENSKILVLVGLGFEPWGNNVRKNLQFKNTVIAFVGDEIMNQSEVGEKKNVIDPHVWQSPLMAKKIIDRITVNLMEVDSANSSYYQKNAAKIKTRLDELDTQYKEGLAHCAQKNIITSHAAFGYVAAEYGFKQVPIAGLSPDAEPSLRQLADIAAFVKANNISYIFFESLASPKLSEILASETGAKTLILNPIEGLTDEQISKGEDYFTEMQNNLANLKIALQCS